MDLSADVVTCVRTRLEDLKRRLVATLGRMSPEDLTWRPNRESNSASNLVVHICGNLRQRFHAGLGGAPDVRDRDAEFAASGAWTTADLIVLVQRTFADVDGILESLPAHRLGEEQMIRAKPTTVLDVLIRVVGHISEHVGQVIYIAKARLGEEFETLSIPRATGR